MRSPSVTLLVATYNHAPYIEEALRGALAQTYGPIEILVADDASTDDTFARAERIAAAYDGPHRLRLHRHAHNIGPIANYRWLCEQATGDWLVTCDGDDVSVPHRVEVVMAAVQARPVGYVCSSARMISERGEVLGLYRPRRGDAVFSLEDVARVGYTSEFLGATCAFDRRVFTEFGHIEEARLAGGGGDHVLPFRGAHFGGATYIDSPLLHYRQHAGQMTRRITDRTQTADVMAEGLLAYNIKNTMHVLQDNVTWASRHPGDARSAAIQQIIMRRLVQEVARWTHVRTSLIARGLRPTWVPKDVLDHVAVPDPFVPVADEG